MRIDIGDGIRLFVDVDGMGLAPDGADMTERPTLVLLHGGPGMDHSLFKADGTETLRDVAQVVYYDHRGNGRSDHGDVADWRLDVWADDVVRLCDALGIDKPVIMGSSFGGFVAQRYLARHPDHPSKVVLSCTSPRLDIDVVAGAFERFGGPEAAAAARAFWAEGPDAFPAYFEHCMPLYSTEPGDEDALARTVMNFELMGHFQLTEQPTMELATGLAHATCPVLVVGGDLDPICPIEMSEEIVGALSNADVTFERLEGASHMDVGPRSLPAVREFLLR